MLSWLGKRLIARNMRKLREGGPGPTLQLDAKDIRYEDTQRTVALDEYLASTGKL